MRITLTFALFALLLPFAAPPAAAYHSAPDGVTARITFVTGAADLVLLPDSAGNYVVEVSVYRSLAGTWQPAAIGSTLRACWLPAGAVAEECPLFVRFTSSVSGPVTVAFPASAVPDAAVIDLFVTFSALEGNPVPTSHHNVLKNALLAQGQYALADQLDFHLPTRPVAL